MRNPQRLNNPPCIMSVQRLTQRSVQQMQTTRKRTDTLHDRWSPVRPEVLRSGHTCLEALRERTPSPHAHYTRKIQTCPTSDPEDGCVCVHVHSLPFGFALTCVGGFAGTASVLCDECPADIDHTAPCTRQSMAFNVWMPRATAGKFDNVHATVFVYLANCED